MSVAREDGVWRCCGYATTASACPRARSGGCSSSSCRATAPLDRAAGRPRDPGSRWCGGSPSCTAAARSGEPGPGRAARARRRLPAIPAPAVTSTAPCRLRAIGSRPRRAGGRGLTTTPAWRSASSSSSGAHRVRSGCDGVAGLATALDSASRDRAHRRRPARHRRTARWRAASAPARSRASHDARGAHGLGLPRRQRALRGGFRPPPGEPVTDRAHRALAADRSVGGSWVGAPATPVLRRRREGAVWATHQARLATAVAPQRLSSRLAPWRGG